MRNLAGVAALLYWSLLLVACVSPSWAQQPAGALSIRQAWARATVPGMTVGGAFLLVNNAGTQDQLLRITSPVATTVEIHQTSMKNGMMQMRQVDKLFVPAHSQVRFAPDGLHIMLVGLRQPLAAGQHFPMTLVFQSAGAIDVDVLVKGLGAE